MTAPLWQETITLGLGHSAIVEITEIDPEPAPLRGTVWSDDLDWPRAQLSIFLPGQCDGYSHAVRLPPDLETKGFDPGWGQCVEGTRRATHRVRNYNRSAVRLDDAVAELQRLATAELAVLIAHCTVRAARLARREATLAAGRTPLVVEPTNERPIEIDSAPRATYAATEDNDDSSQRFALLEMDPPTPSQSTQTKIRRRRAA